MGKRRRIYKPASIVDIFSRFSPWNNNKTFRVFVCIKDERQLRVRCREIQFRGKRLEREIESRIVLVCFVTSSAKDLRNCLSLSTFLLSRYHKESRQRSLLNTRDVKESVTVLHSSCGTRFPRDRIYPRRSLSPLLNHKMLLLFYLNDSLGLTLWCPQRHLMQFTAYSVHGSACTRSNHAYFDCITRPKASLTCSPLTIPHPLGFLTFVVD